MYKLLVTIFSFCVVIHHSVEWSGNTCAYKKLSYVARRTCSSRFIWCWNEVTVYQPVYSTAYKCCTGWTHSGDQNCIVPICYPECENGGTCAAPNQCRCRPGNAGSTCSGYDCSHAKPCYPGQCYVRGTTVNCDCHSDFEGSSCSTLKHVQDPEITETKVRMSFWERGGKSTTETYGRLVYITEESKSVTVWTSLAKYNRFNVTAVARFKGRDLPLRPDYINRADTGLVAATINVKHEKKTNMGSISVVDEDTNCNNIIDYQHPQKMVECLVKDDNYDKSLENGDKLTFTFSVSSGGFRELYDINAQGIANTERYQGYTASSSVVFNFDFVKPFNTREDEAFQLRPEFSKGPISLFWDGWSDDVSGIQRYTWEVFKLEPNGNGDLTERDRLKPIIHRGVNHKNPINYPPPYQPDKPGMYSFILEVVDRANNSVHVRRLALFDDQSSVSSDPDVNISISSASGDKEYNWNTGISDTVTVIWRNHFLNREHVQGKFLNKVLDFSEKIIDHPPVFKSVTKPNDDQEGTRTTDRVPNSRGIVSFEFSLDVEKAGGVSKQVPSVWKEVGLNDTLTLKLNTNDRVTQGSTVTVWIRARDALNNWMDESVSVTFDITEPRFSRMVFHKNQVSDIPFSSGLELGIMDEESGIAHVMIQLRQKYGGRHISNQKLSVKPIQPSDCTDKTSRCYCPNVLNVCYNRKYILPISNCWFLLANETLKTHEVEMEITVVNRAGLMSSKTHLVENVLTLNGTKAYLGPTDVEVEKVSESTARVTWIHAPSCFPRSFIWISYQSDSGSSEPVSVFKDAEYFDLTDLEPGQSYTVKVIVDYGGTKSEAKQISFKTPDKEVLGIAAIIGIVLGVIVLLAVLVIGLILWRTGRAGAIIRRGQSVYRGQGQGGRRINNELQPSVFANNAYKADDDIYLYGIMPLECHQINKEELTLLEEISAGRFARIYRAEYRVSNEHQEVAAKVIKDPPNEETNTLMMAKINFAHRKVGEHRNVLRFVGAVTHDDALGPVMVYEYCGNGQLDKWLIAHQSRVNNEVMEDIQTFALDIARGMEFLAKKGIAHRKLAARNCLLTLANEVKVSGFGPLKPDDAYDEDASKSDRIPIKWTAPECLHSLKGANEKSDIWSFGITLWEIFSMGQVPYGKIRSRDLPIKVRNGHRLEKPENAEDVHVRMMQSCWVLEPDSRPTFSEIVGQLEATFGIKPTECDDMYYYAR